MTEQVRQERAPFGFVNRLVDSTIVLGGLFLLQTLLGIRNSQEYTILATLAVVVFGLAAQAFGLYENWYTKSRTSLLSLLLRVWVGVLMVLVGIAFLTKTSAIFSRRVITIWSVGTPILLMSWRVLLQLVLARIEGGGRARRTVAIAGAGVLGLRVATALRRHHWMGFDVGGFYDDQKPAGTEVEGIPVLGDLDQFAEETNSGRWDRVYISLPMRAEARIKQTLSALADCSVPVEFVPDFFSFDLLQAQWKDLAGIPVVSVQDTPISGTNAIVKRAEDLIVGSLILLLITPILLLVALAVKLTSRGPVLFKQRRYGLGGHEVSVWKFRSMTVMEDGDKVKQASKGDSRITPVGRFLRRTSLDELPQFINVITGQMSIVGPRPHAVAHNEQYRRLIPTYMRRHLVKPGITGWAQVNGWRGETDTLNKMEKRVEYDLWYIRNWSLFLDLKIIFFTIFKGFTSRNAY